MAQFLGTNSFFRETQNAIKGTDSQKTESKRGIATIQTTQTAVIHGLGRVPKCILWSPKANAVVYESALPDENKFYVRASNVTDIYWRVE